MKIALALSGGGHRAAAFHLGVLKYLAECNLLEKVSDISSTSGGSILIGQLFHSSGPELIWPSSKTFLSHSLPYCKKQIVEESLEASFIKRMFSPKNWLLMGHRANLMARSLNKNWAISALMKQLPEKPNWVINGTANISGNRWHVKKNNGLHEMGSPGLGCIDSSNFPIADAIAISAAYPGVIGPYRLRNHLWDVYLSDGGLYDNLGLEPLFDIEQRRLKKGLTSNFLLVSDAGMSIERKRLAPVWRPLLRTLRLIDVINHQVRSLRLRTLLPFIKSNSDSACYIAIGTQSRDVGLNDSETEKFKEYEFLDEARVDQAKNTPTSLASLPENDFDILVRHGYETAMLQLFQLTQKQLIEA